MQCVGGYRANLERLHSMAILDVWSIYAYVDRKPGAPCLIALSKLRDSGRMARLLLKQST